MDAIECILARRTQKLFTGEPVSNDQIHKLLELATFAPNHRLTEPWRFFVCPHEHIPRLAETVVSTIRDDEDQKLLRKREIFKRRLPKLGAFIGVGYVPVKDDPRTAREDYAACCCAVQNIMLGATAMGLGSFWSTGRLFDRPPVRELLNMPEDVVRVAAIWLGVPTKPSKCKRRPAQELTTWVE